MDKQLEIETNARTVEVNGITVEYGRIPIGIIEEHSGIIFYFKTRDAYNTELHENTIKPLLMQLEHDNYDHGVYWDLVKCEAVVWNRFSQVSVVSFRIRDSY